MSIIKKFKSWFAPKMVAEVVNQPEYTDIFGNIIHEGDPVIRVCYNDKRLKYATILLDYTVIPFKKTMRFKVFSYNAYGKSVRKESQKDGFIHIYRA